MHTVIIHEDGWGQYARILRIPNIFRMYQYEKYDHLLKVTDTAQLDSFRDSAQEIADENFVNGSKLRSMSKHYEFMSHTMHRYGLKFMMSHIGIFMCILEKSYLKIYLNTWIYQNVNM